MVVANAIARRDPIIKSIMSKIRAHGEEALVMHRNQEENRKRGNNMIQSQSMEIDASHNLDASGEMNEDEANNCEDDDEEINDDYKCFRDPEDLKEIKWLMQTKGVKAAVPFNTNILRIALNLREEKIAMMLVAFYEIEID